MWLYCPVQKKLDVGIPIKAGLNVLITFCQCSLDARGISCKFSLYRSEFRSGKVLNETKFSFLEWCKNSAKIYAF